MRAISKAIGMIAILSGEDVVDDILADIYGWDAEIRDEAHDVYMDFKINGKVPQITKAEMKKELI